MRLFLIAIFIGLTATAIFGFAIQEPKRTSNNTDDVMVPKVTYCELMKHPERFDYRVVQVSAVFERGFEKSYLYDDEGCNKGLRRADTWVSHDQSFVIDGDSEEAKINNEISGFGVWSINAIGRFRRGKGPQQFGHLGCCRYEFALMKVVRSEKLRDRAR